MRIQFDSKINVSWGYYFCEGCNSRFYDGKTQVHLEGCSGDGNVVYCFGRKEALNVLKAGRSVYSSLKISDLESSFPDLVDELREAL